MTTSDISDAAALRRHFLGWQCRIRQHAIRHAGGRPSPGMRPAVVLADGPGDLGQITTLIVRAEPEEMTAQFRHTVLKTHDPAERYAAALRFLAAAYYQGPEDFSDELTALFGPDSDLAARLRAAGRCRLDFAQYNQSYRLPSTVRRLAEAAPAFQATYWHNALFNAQLPGGVSVLAFQPDWNAATVEPPAA